MEPIEITPKVNPGSEFYEIANNFTDHRELIREALSNSFDADATEVYLRFSLKHKPGTSHANMICIDINDNGEGLSYIAEGKDKVSNLEAFFNLGDSNKQAEQIGSKGHGTKIYYQCKSIKLESWRKGSHITAITSPEHCWDLLKQRLVPPYKYYYDTQPGRGTKISITDFITKQNLFNDVNDLKMYVIWYTIIGSFKPYFDKKCKKMDVYLKTYQNTDFDSYEKVPFGFLFPDPNTELNTNTDDYCQILEPLELILKNTAIKIEIVGAILGKNKRKLIPQTYSHSGIWLCKDYIKIERANNIIKDVFNGEHWYQNFLIFANCQQFELTADRGSIIQDSTTYDVVIQAITNYIENIKNDLSWKNYMELKNIEDERDKHIKEEEKRQNMLKHHEEVINEYTTRPNLECELDKNLFLKEPENEDETAMLLQSMVSTGVKGIDFTIGAYNTKKGVDLIIEYKRPGISRKVEWAELVHVLDAYWDWTHQTDFIERIICWTIGDKAKMEKKCKERCGKIPKLIEKESGRYTLIIGTQNIEVYVLEEILNNNAKCG